MPEGESLKLKQNVYKACPYIVLQITTIIESRWSHYGCVVVGKLLNNMKWIIANISKNISLAFR